MKHRLSLRTKDAVTSFLIAFALLLSCLMACDGAETPSPADGMTSGNPAQNAGGEESGKTEPDYSDFVMPAETDTLILYSGNWLQSDIFRKAILVFRELYPSVKVELKNMGDEEYVTTLRTEIPVGRGPDLVLGSSSYDLRDVYKSMEAGVFEDLNPYIAADDTFSLDDYVVGIMDAGVFKGERLVMPFSHRPLILTTSEELLSGEGITLEELGTHDGFMAVCERYRKENPGEFFLDEGMNRRPEDRLLTQFRQMYVYAGLQFFDYENREVTLDREELRKICDLVRLYDPETVENERTEEEKKKRQSFGKWDLILKRKSLFYYEESAGLSFMMTRYTISKKGETPVSLLMPDIGGTGCTEISYFIAIPKGAQNKRNAWRFLKILLSEEIQGDSEDVMSIFSPVLKSAAKTIMENQGYPDERIDAIAETLNAIDRAYMLPPIQWIYLRDHMMPYIEENKDFDTCFDKLINVLKLYIEE